MAGVEPVQRGRGLRAAILSLALELIDELVASVHRAVSALPGYRDLTREQVAEVSAAIRWVFVTVNDCLTTERPLRPAEIKHLADIGASRALWGIPFEVFQQVLTIGLHHAVCQLREIAAELGDDGSVRDEIVTDLMRLLTQVDTARERGYENVAGLHIVEQAAERTSFVGTVLEDAGASESDMVAMATRLGIDRRGGCGMIIAVPRSDASADLHEVADRLMAAIGRAGAAAVRSDPSAHVVVLHGGALTAKTRAAVADAAAALGVAATTEHALRWAPLGAAYRRLRPYAHVLGVQDTHVVDVDRLIDVYEPLACLRLAVAEARIREVFGPYAALPAEGQKWVRIFKALDTHDWVIKYAAPAVPTHPNTLTHWLDEYSETTGIDLRTFRGRKRASEAAWLLDLFGDRLPPWGDPRWR